MKRLFLLTTSVLLLNSCGLSKLLGEPGNQDKKLDDVLIRGDQKIKANRPLDGKAELPIAINICNALEEKLNRVDRIYRDTNYTFQNYSSACGAGEQALANKVLTLTEKRVNGEFMFVFTPNHDEYKTELLTHGSSVLRRICKDARSSTDKAYIQYPDDSNRNTLQYRFFDQNKVQIAVYSKNTGFVRRFEAYEININPNDNNGYGDVKEYLDGSFCREGSNVKKYKRRVLISKSLKDLN